MKKIDLTCKDIIEDIENNLGTTEWISVLEFSDNKDNICEKKYYSALISNKKVKEIVKKYEWDLTLGGGRPGFITNFRNGKSISKYYRYSEKGIEPLVYWRTFFGKEKPIAEVSEEFRLYFNLFEKQNNNSRIYIYTSEDGDEDEVVLINENKVSIKLKYIKEFLSAKKMHLAIFFEAMRFSNKTLKQLKQKEIDKICKKNNLIFSLCVRDLSLGDKASQGWLLGKKLISGQKNFKYTFWENREKEKCEEFIVGIDKEGQEILNSCNCDYKSYFSHLTPVFFSREVLKKYYDNPNKYSVEDGSICRDDFWRLRVMNNHTDYVVVWLGDLKNIPNKEQAHWKGFNISPSQKNIAWTDYERNINGKFTDPEHPELFFKYKFNQFQEAWEKKFGWYLFMPLSFDDEHYLKSLHVCTTDDKKEFDDQIFALNKLLIESLNVKKLKQGLKLEKKKPSKLDIFNECLKSKHIYLEAMFVFLINLKAIKNAISHRKSKKDKDYEAAKEYFGINKKENIKISEDIFIKCIWMLNSLINNFELDI